MITSLRLTGVRLLAVTALTLGLFAGSTGIASAHSLDSTTIAITLADDSVDATITLALQTVDEALGIDHLGSDVTDFEDDIVDYLAAHLSAVSADGTAWDESFSSVEVETVEGFESITVDVEFDTHGSTVSQFSLSYDAVIEAIPSHQAVVVLIDSTGGISTVGVLDTDGGTLVITDSSHHVPASDMIEYGFEHVLEGADHLLFLVALLLPAPLVTRAGRWRPGEGALRPLRRVVHVVTAFTLGHSATLMASALGWVTVPSTPVEIAIALSVGVSAVHAMRPLTAHGEEIIAAVFGLVHGLAFAGILDGLGLEGTKSLLTLLAFNVGIELAQLAAIGVVFPSLWVLSRTRFYPGFRLTAAGLGLLAALGWMIERIGLASNPLAALEELAIAHPGRIAGSLAVLAVGAVAINIRTTRPEPSV